jgi:thiamine-phosphate pyrophosphorylase
VTRPDESIDPAEVGRQLLLFGPPRVEPPFAEQLDAALTEGGVAGFVLPVRAFTPAADSALVARSVRAVCARRGVAFLLQADPVTALEIGADGVHMAGGGSEVAACRATLGGERILGVSCGHSRDAAMIAGDAGADYVAFGDLDRPPAPELYDLLAWWHELFVLPCLAEAAIAVEDCARLARAGADFVAAGQAVWRHPEGAAAAIRRLGEALRAA